MGAPTTTVLSSVAFELCWKNLGLGELPLALGLRQHGATFAERDRSHDEERARLVQRGLWARGQACPVPALVAALGVLAAPDLLVDLRAGGPEPDVRATAASQGSRGVLAVHRQRASTVELTPVHPDSLGPAVLELLGKPDRVGQGSVSVPAAELDAMFEAVGRSDGRGAALLTSRLRGAGCPPGDAEAVGTALAQPRWVAQVGVTLGHGPNRRRVPRILAVVDTARGRYLLVTRPAPDRSRWTTVLPAAPNTVRTAVDELVAETRPRQDAWSF